MTEIISARFKPGGKAYYFDPSGLTIKAGDALIVETSKGQEYGECVKGNTQVEDDQVVHPLRPVIRFATEKDMETVEKNREKEKKAFAVCQEKIAEHKLDMKLVDVEYSFDGSKILFFFTSENRVDFRALVKDLAGIFRARIELRQIGVRDEAKMLGGLGICGRPFCCSQFLDEFQPVSIKMAKTQSLSLNPTKISGTCGRLMCCLKYEQEAYEDAVKRCPKQESFVETPDGVGTVTNVNLLRETVKVRLDDEPEAPKCFHNCEICVVRNGKGKRPDDYVAPPKEELEKLRKVTPKADPNGELGRRLDSLLGETSQSPVDSAEPKPAGEKPASRRERRTAPKKAKGEPKKQEAKKEQPRKAQQHRSPRKTEDKAKHTSNAEEKPARSAVEDKAPAAEGEKKPNNRGRRNHYYHRGKGGSAPKAK